MDFKEALRKAADDAGWSPAKIAGEVGVSETAARRWLSGEREPRLPQYRALLKTLPGFAALMDGGDLKASA